MLERVKVVLDRVAVKGFVEAAREMVGVDAVGVLGDVVADEAAEVDRVIVGEVVVSDTVADG